MKLKHKKLTKSKKKMGRPPEGHKYGSDKDKLGRDPLGYKEILAAMDVLPKNKKNGKITLHQHPLFGRSRHRYRFQVFGGDR